MNDVTLQRRVVIINPNGLHLRPMKAFVETALRFQSQVTVVKEQVNFDGKSPLALLGLAAVQGTILVIETSGPDAQAALDALMKVLTDLATAEEVSSDPPPTSHGQLTTDP